MSFLRLLCAVWCVVIGIQIEARAQAQPEIVSADAITRALTRKIGFRQKDDDAYSTPDTSAHISLPSITFDLDKSDLTPAARRQLDQVGVSLSELLRDGDAKILVEGHTCDRGQTGHNLTLSELRAQSVLAYLARNGVPSGRMTARGRGELRPVRPNTSEANRRLNRRVDFVYRVPARQTRSLTRQFFEATVKAKPEAGNELVDNAIRRLRVGDSIRIDVEIRESSFVYVLYVDSGGEGQWLYPEDPETGPLWRYVGEDLHFPPDEEESYPLTTSGRRECIAIVATQDRAPQPGELLRQIDALIRSGGGNSSRDTKVLREALSSGGLQARLLVFEVE